ncbi:TonB-dependent siderophore receptor [Pseudoruegeria sp. HB172150]|uniref:TonB-dependent siderophore receptor n=1 Tax=Pseudoruegeria sp. HB172150 TaxID=2721164 RepID=UPI00352BECC4
MAALLGCTALVLPTGATAQSYEKLGTVYLEGIEDDSNTIVAGTESTGTKTDADILDTPASVSVVTEKEIELRGASNLQDILSYTAGVTVDEFGTDDRYDYYRIRGFDELAMGTYRDGLPVRGFGWTFPRSEPYAFDRVEILKGSNSSLFGLNAPGGLVNQTTKRPKPYKFGEVYTTFGEDHIEFGTDFGDVLDENGVWSYRVTAKWQDSAYTYDYSNDDRAYLGLALSYRPTDATELTFLANYNDRDGVPGIGFPAGIDIDRTTFLGEPEFNKFNTIDRNVGLAFSHDFGNGLKFRSNARYGLLDVDYEQVYGGSTTPAVDREAFAVYSDSEQFAWDNQLIYETSFGSIDSRTMVGLEYSWLKVDETAYYGIATGIDINNIAYCGSSCVTLFNYIDWVPEQTTRAIYAQEELTFSDRWIATLGVRYDDVDVSVEDHLYGTTTDKNYTAFTKRMGLTYKATPNLSFYANYSESFEPNVWNLAEDPKEGTQYEVGLKYRPEGVNALITAAVFDLTQTNVNSYVTPTTQRQIGEVGVRGFELEGKMALNERANLTFAYSYWDAEIREDGIAGNVGNRPSRVPEHIASIWADYTLPGEGWRGDMTFGLGVRYVGDTFGDDANTTKVPGYTLVDAAFVYGVTDDVDLSLNVLNLFDKEYVASSYYGTEYYGDGRTILATLKYSW